MRLVLNKQNWVKSQIPPKTQFIATPDCPNSPKTRTDCNARLEAITALWCRFGGQIIESTRMSQKRIYASANAVPVANCEQKKFDGTSNLPLLCCEIIARFNGNEKNHNYPHRKRVSRGI